MPMLVGEGKMPSLANIIFPAPSAVYFAHLFYPLAAILALASEFAVFVYFQRGVMSKSNIVGVVVLVNIFSWLVGIILSALLPSGLVPKLMGDSNHHFYTVTQSPQWGTIAILSFFWACFLSSVIEYAALRLLRRALPFERLAVCVGVTNFVSYCVIGATVAGFGWF